MTTLQLANELTLEAQVRDAAQAFAQTLADTPEFQAFDERYVAFKHDRAAQEATRLFQEKQRSLQMMQQLGALSQHELDELDRLRDAMTEVTLVMNQSSVHAYMDAQNELILLCQAAAQELSAMIGLDFAGACVSGCCG